jgi:hypothetical protein
MSAAVSPSARQALGYCHVKWLEQTTALKSVLRVSQGGQCIPGAALVGGSGWNPFTPVIGATLSPPSPSEPMRCDQSKPFDTPSKVLSVGKLRGVIRTFFCTALLPMWNLSTLLRLEAGSSMAYKMLDPKLLLHLWHFLIPTSSKTALFQTS